MLYRKLANVSFTEGNSTRCKRVSSSPPRSALIGLLTGSAALAAASLAQVQPAAAAATETETVLYEFKGGNDGANPHAGLISDSTGALYGTTWRGGGTGCVGGRGCGTVFKLTPPAAGQTKWTKKILYRFQGGSDGEAPFAPLTFDSKGAPALPTVSAAKFSTPFPTPTSILTELEERKSGDAD